MGELPFIKRKSSVPNWYVWYTKPRAEKKVFERLLSKDLEVYLPLRKELKQWSDRKKWVESPMFNGYIFTFLPQRDFQKVRFTEGIIGNLSFGGKPAFVTQKAMESLKLLVESDIEFEITEEKFKKGTKVTITSGPFIGEDGEIVAFKGSKKIAVKIDGFGKYCLLQIHPDLLQVSK